MLNVLCSMNHIPPLDPLPCQFHLINSIYLGRGKYYLIAISSARNVEFLRNSPFVISLGEVYKSMKARNDAIVCKNKDQLTKILIIIVLLISSSHGRL
jgi:hypothetical protein